MERPCKSDSLLWTTPANNTESFGRIKLPDNFAEVAERLLNDPEFQRQLEKRVSPYGTKVTWQILMTTVD